jgi:hypothetical protein
LISTRNGDNTTKILYIPFGLINVFPKEICVESLYVYVSSFHTKEFRQDFPWFLATTEQIQKQIKEGKSRKKQQ